MWSSQGHDSAEAKEIAAILAEENVELVPEEDKDKLQELDSLTGQPRPDDVLLYAIPVRSELCADCTRSPLNFVEGDAARINQWKSALVYIPIL